MSDGEIAASAVMHKLLTDVNVVRRLPSTEAPTLRTIKRRLRNSVPPHSVEISAKTRAGFHGGPGSSVDRGGIKPVRAWRWCERIEAGEHCTSGAECTNSESSSARTTLRAWLLHPSGTRVQGTGQPIVCCKPAIVANATNPRRLRRSASTLLATAPVTGRKGPPASQSAVSRERVQDRAPALPLLDVVCW